MDRAILQSMTPQCKPANFSDLQSQCVNSQKVDIQDEISFPLSTSGMKIVDSKGRRVRLHGANWSGGHLIRQCPSGLEKLSLNQLVSRMKDYFQINCVRLCYSIQMLFDQNPVKEEYISANPDLKNLTPFQILNRTIEALTNARIMVILNCHTSKSQWCCSKQDGDGLWYNNEYPEDIFFKSAQKLAFRHKNNPRVIGIDLRNQIRPSTIGSPTWGTGDLATDWKIAAQKCAQKVLNIAPHWLIFVGGLDFQTDLSPVIKFPIKLSVPNKLVYTGHLYHWSWNGRINQDMKDLEYYKFEQLFFQTQTFVRALGVPYLLGQFGNDNQCSYWKLLERYINERDLDFTYWCLDGYKCENQKQKGSDQTYGLFNYNFDGVRHDFKGLFCKLCACKK